jgi:stearoyl-CoA desaturase (delta-9 desaturase)
MTRRGKPKLKPWTLFGIIVVHSLALVAVLPMFFTWWGVGLFVFMWWLTASLGVSMGYHRLFTHRAFKAQRWFRNLLAFLAALALEMGPILWSATHRQHHRESDKSNDPHSPKEKGFWWAHLLWMLYEDESLSKPEQIQSLVPDLYQDKILQHFDRRFVWYWVAVMLLFFFVGWWLGGFKLGVSLAIWGGPVRTVVVWHCTWFVNSVTHLFGYQTFTDTGDDSRNLWWVALTTFGEGWHNNHHKLAGRANYGYSWRQPDPTYWAICVFEKLRLVYDVNRGRSKTSST